MMMMVDQDKADDPFRQLIQQARTTPILQPAQPGRTPAKRRRRDAFIQVPLWWAGQMTKATGTPKAFIGLWLLYRAWKLKSYIVPLPNGQLKARGISRKVKRRALQELEAASLIKVDRRHGKTPIVTLLHL
jgi:hypothetical protein